jgi:hypothetical protein
VDLLIGFGVLLVLGYVNKSAGWFPKYQVALAPLLACMGAPVVAHLWCARRRLLLLVGLVATLASLSTTLALVRDEWALQRTWAIPPGAGAGLLGIVVIAGVVGLAARAAAPAALVAIFGMAIGWSIAVDALQLGAPYQTDYWYGTTGVAEAADWVSSHLGPDQTYVAAKEVAIRSRDQRYVDQDDIVSVLGSGRPLPPAWQGEPIAALVTWQREPYVADLFRRAMAGAAFREEARFGDYVVYVPSS